MFSSKRRGEDFLCGQFPQRKGNHYEEGKLIITDLDQTYVLSNFFASFFVGSQAFHVSQVGTGGVKSLPM